jgi:GNAT superfamily N-acetyltransferase
VSAPLSTRLATIDDYPSFARLFPELAVPDPTPSLESFGKHWLPRVVIASDAANTVVGYSFWNLFGDTFHVSNVVTAPEARRRGVGRVLLDDLRQRAREAGAVRWYLNVKQDNAVAIRLYERCGFAIDREGWTLTVPWEATASLPHAPYARAVAAIPDDDARIAQFLAVDHARVARARSRQGAVLTMLEDSTGVVGFGAFDPSFPGVHPIALAHPDLARALLESFRPQARHDYVRVMIDGDRALADLLRDGGATLNFALFRMGASLE